jgi:hypothetical protein
LSQLDPPLAQAVADRLSLEQFHHDEALATMLADVVDRADVRVVQGRSGPGFALEAQQRMWIP